ncbi:thymidylate kinase-like isoform X2 [Leptonychotes weddellii]|uniref:dTMP kinase n=1 Tax=Leptonychotes weddellii TaxID=9713 RepID=A0A7F8QC66_LEPWE|nr:thymidylate kinase-like isoform X2 [Leptonychotes weddellii]
MAQKHALFFRPLIKKKLSQGVTLVVDRYAFSGVAFTSAKENFSLDWCKQPDVGLPKPDLVVFLQLRLAEAAMRGEFGRERYENGNFQERALHRFHQLMADETLNWKSVLCGFKLFWIYNTFQTLQGTRQEGMKSGMGVGKETGNRFLPPSAGALRPEPPHFSSHFTSFSLRTSFNISCRVGLLA